MPPVRIRVENVSKIFGPRPGTALVRLRSSLDKGRLLEETGHALGLHDSSIEIRAAETFVAIGLSGPGKSTLIRHFNRLIEPTEGRIVVHGEGNLGYSEPELRSFLRHKVAMVFQRFGLLPRRTVAEA